MQGGLARSPVGAAGDPLAATSLCPDSIQDRRFVLFDPGLALSVDGSTESAGDEGNCRLYEIVAGEIGLKDA